MPDLAEHRESLDVEAIRLRFDRFRQYEDAAGGPLTPAEHVNAIASAWDVEPLLAAVDRVRALADGMAAESPKPGPGGFIAEGIYDALGGDGDRVAAGSGTGSADGPTPDGRPAATHNETGDGNG